MRSGCTCHYLSVKPRLGLLEVTRNTTWIFPFPHLRPTEYYVTFLKFLGFFYSDVDDVDIFPGAMCEQSVEGGIAGPTFACIIANTFKHLRQADRFWYENPEGGFTQGKHIFIFHHLRERIWRFLAQF